MKTMLWLMGVLFFTPCAYADYQAETLMDGYTIVATFKSSHPFLAEYHRFIEIKKGGISLFKGDLGVDPGGFDYINIFKNKDVLVFQSFTDHAYLLDTKNAKVTSTDYDVEGDLPKMIYRGQFKVSKDADFLFVPAEKFSKPNYSMVKGG